MNREQRQEAIFGAYDGVVSIIGFVFGLILHHASSATIAVGGLGGAIAAGVSMSTGELEKSNAPLRSKLPVGVAMLCATLVGSLIPIVAFFFLPTGPALAVAIVGCLLVATWIGHAKRQGARGYLTSYATIFAAALLTLGIVSLIPQSA